MKVMILNGPNLNLLGIREPNHYGKETYADLIKKIEGFCHRKGISPEFYQSNHEGDLVDAIHRAYFEKFDGIVINPGAYTHTSIALLDAVKSTMIPTVEVHISKVEEREDFRQVSYIRAACIATITGKGTDGYLMAIDHLAKHCHFLLRRKLQANEPITLRPGKAAGTVQAPPSKSMAHRLLIGAGLAKGTSVIHNIAPSQDVLATIDCLQALGATVHYEGTTATITGADPKVVKNALLSCRESGSTLRFMVPLCLLSQHTNQLSGSDRLMERPQSVYEELCRQKGWLFQKEANTITVAGPLTGGNYTLAGDVSSQFITGLLFALPLTGQNSTITLTGKIESRSYIDLTLQALQAFGIEATWADQVTITVKAGVYSPCTLTVEGDYSNAAFLEGFSLLGGQVTVSGLDPHSLQGDKIYQKDFEALRTGCPTLSLKNCPDLGPVYMALAAALHGAVLTNTARLKIKESDRGAAMAEELKKFGIAVTIDENCITVHSAPLTPPTQPLCGHNDHRIVMALSLLCTITGGQICGANAIAKSFPDYFEQIQSLGIEVE